MNEKSLSKFLSLILRHKPEAIGIALDKEGWASTKEIIQNMNTRGIAINLEDIKKIVIDNNKQRFKLSEDNTRIRANQGHSIQIELGLQAVKPPIKLYHGTAITNRDSIYKEGINKGNRQYVHLSSNIETARMVGQRHGKPIILEIAAEKMFSDGEKFYLSENGVWLTAFVPAKYISNEF